ncbi:ABC transporter substrate-binding protein [Anaerocolumna cellulosilytica]|uniref:ABC transporter substrate-binding protein n=1 Tax=Anaerocolumna cellulosilytica TaxID=433286 RepID=A0A6S6R9W1_9FIRM|nr:metal ABC transporter substrate-binding protein [Anaerocolumna cellulosilytica]MBB5195111.1 zinc transport system substrate-binding protein [Anaerocolumna cellulosilytica]BCJ96052.1 ABC transporter substrate-binding protein [Anaerocolumna cellulosilytica]
MIKNILKMVLFLCSVLVLTGCGNTVKNNRTESDIVTEVVKEDETGTASETVNDKLTIYTSFYPMYDLTKKIGGDKVEVTNLVPAGTEPHDWEPSSTDIVNLENGDLLIYNGAGMEHWVEDITQALQNKSLKLVEASIGVELVEGGHSHEDEEHEEEEEAHEAENSYDPHVWLSIRNAKKEMEVIKNALVEADPDNKEYYEDNYTAFAAKFDELDTRFTEELTKLENKDIVVAHEAFAYLCKDYGLKQVAVEGLSPDSEPDAKRMAEIIEFAKENNIKTIFFEELVSPKVAETIAFEVGAETAVLNPLEGLTEEQLTAGEDYLSIMEYNLEALIKALSK